jgi:hypothetical protein
MSGITLDEHGHIETIRLPSGATAGVIEGPSPGAGRIVYSMDGNPARGYDRVWRYDTLKGALDSLWEWNERRGKGKPRGYSRDMKDQPIEGDER